MMYLGLSLHFRLSPSAKRFLIRQTIALLTFKPFMMSEVVLPVHIKFPHLTSIATYT
uniref:Uncharacterized protein n=1 Tax=Lepeophtheirus salmonis TaxID=72036 RepID=A0A0K2U1R1_LEPSM